LARESVVFDQAHSTAPWTLPSHASLFTGRQSCELLTDYVTPLPARYPTLAEHLQGLGYATAAFVANWHYCVPEFGLDRGFLHYDGPRTWSSRALLATTWSSRITRLIYRRLFDRKNHLGRKSAAVINAECLRWLDRRPDQPFFIFLNYMDTHTPYTPPRAFEHRFGPEVPKDPGLHNYWYNADFEYSSAERQRIVDAYDSSLAYLDDQLAKLFGELKRRKLDQSTLVIVVGDHGEMLGEHDLFEHANCLYSEVIRVPLLVRLPSQGQAAQARRADPVSIADVPSTIADVLRLTESPFPGMSLLSASKSPAARRPVYFEVERNPFAQIRKTPASDGDMQGVVVDGMYYIRNANGREEVYDLERDPGQIRDLSQMETGQVAIDRSRRIVEMAKKQRPRD
jgi:arylsulfatase A-like enzyme